MVAVDTNVLIRLLVDDPGAAQQVELARKTVREVEQVYLTQIVQVESVWVLQSVYKIDKHDIATKLTELAGNLRYELQGRNSFLKALAIFRNCSADFADCLILAESQMAECKLLTFDKQLGRLDGAQLLSTSP